MISNFTFFTKIFCNSPVLITGISATSNQTNQHKATHSVAVNECTCLYGFLPLCTRKVVIITSIVTETWLEMKFSIPRKLQSDVKRSIACVSGKLPVSPNILRRANCSSTDPSINQLLQDLVTKYYECVEHYLIHCVCNAIHRKFGKEQQYCQVNQKHQQSCRSVKNRKCL